MFKSTHLHFWYLVVIQKLITNKINKPGRQLKFSKIVNIRIVLIIIINNIKTLKLSIMIYYIIGVL